VYCYENKAAGGQHKSFVMDEIEIDQRMTDILSRGDCDELELIGGEIFLYPDKVRYVFSKYGDCLGFILTTNGTIRNEAINKILGKYKPTIGVSLDDPRTVERQRVGIDFEQVLANAKYWRSITRVVICAVITPQNIRRIKETFDFYVLEHGFKTIHFGCAEEWMNAYYWQVYLREVERLIMSTPPDILRQATVSPWKYYSVNRKEYVYENGVEKVERLDPTKMELSAYRESRYAGYCLYCQRIGVTPVPLIPDGVEVVSK
jgi:sulfatase maturation enzyme AslB (radical SAM superfamily)